jgi:hypothetical protein
MSETIEIGNDTSASSAALKRENSFRVSKVVWVLAFLGMGFETVDGWSMLHEATSAPQQAAAAGMACFYLIAMYVLARAIDEITR